MSEATPSLCLFVSLSLYCALTVTRAYLSFPVSVGENPSSAVIYFPVKNHGWTAVSGHFKDGSGPSPLAPPHPEWLSHIKPQFLTVSYNQTSLHNLIQKPQACVFHNHRDKDKNMPPSWGRETMILIVPRLMISYIRHNSDILIHIQPSISKINNQYTN